MARGAFEISKIGLPAARGATPYFLARYRSETGFVSFCSTPSYEAAEYATESEPFAFGVSFTGHKNALTAQSGAERTRDIPPASAGLNGASPLTWLHVPEPSENLELHPGAALLEEVEGLTGCDWRGIDAYRPIGGDAVVLGAALRCRAAMSRGFIDEDELDDAVRAVTLHVAVTYAGGSSRGLALARLDMKRLSRLHAFLSANLPRRVSLQEMSDIAALSTFHLHRAFRAATGLTPAAYALGMRVEHAHRLIAAGVSRQAAARAIGISDMAYFRRSLRKFGLGRFG